MISIDIAPFANGCHAKVEGLLTPRTFDTVKDWVEALNSFGQEHFIDATELVCSSQSICREFLALFDGAEFDPVHGPVAEQFESGQIRLSRVGPSLS